LQAQNVVMANLIIFVVASAGIVAFSWQSLGNSRSHGFCRFFAFECILILVLLNRNAWFHDPLSSAQIISWILLCASLGLAAHGFYLLVVIGRPEGHFENTTAIVMLGAYKYIRHPLYTSLMLFTWGTFLKDLSLQGVMITTVGTALLFATARVEESENIHKFGEEYAAYMVKTKMFIPHVF
jgi:protein-S-isoprenylcysteine O-methyltransferase Ste14